MGNIVGRPNSLSSRQREIIIGSLLGDGRLERRSRKITARFRVHHSWDQRAYVDWKYQELKNIVSTSPKKITWYDEKRDIRNVAYYFHTLTLKALGELHTMFYRKDEKRVPEEIVDFLTPLVLAVWIMDDGNYSKESLVLNTHSFPEKDERILQKGLKRKYGVTTSRIKDRDAYKIRVASYSWPKLRSVVEPYIIPEMKYKLGPRNDSV